MACGHLVRTAVLFLLSQAVIPPVHYQITSLLDDRNKAQTAYTGAGIYAAVDNACNLSGSDNTLVIYRRETRSTSQNTLFVVTVWCSSLPSPTWSRHARLHEGHPHLRWKWRHPVMSGLCLAASESVRNQRRVRSHFLVGFIIPISKAWMPIAPPPPPPPSSLFHFASFGAFQSLIMTDARASCLNTIEASWVFVLKIFFFYPFPTTRHTIAGINGRSWCTHSPNIDSCGNRGSNTCA